MTAARSKVVTQVREEPPYPRVQACQRYAARGPGLDRTSVGRDGVKGMNEPGKIGGCRRQVEVVAHRGLPGNPGDHRPRPGIALPGLTDGHRDGNRKGQVGSQRRQPALVALGRLDRPVDDRQPDDQLRPEPVESVVRSGLRDGLDTETGGEAVRRGAGGRPTRSGRRLDAAEPSPRRGGTPAPRSASASWRPSRYDDLLRPRCAASRGHRSAGSAVRRPGRRTPRGSRCPHRLPGRRTRSRRTAEA